MTPAQVKETAKRIGDICHATGKHLDPDSGFQRDVIAPLLRQVQSLADCLGYLADSIVVSGTATNAPAADYPRHDAGP